jgi:hypothetical protein
LAAREVVKCNLLSVCPEDEKGLMISQHFLVSTAIPHSPQKEKIEREVISFNISDTGLCTGLFGAT